MTNVTYSTITAKQPARRPLDRGVACLAAVCDGLFDGRTRRRTQAPMDPKNLYASTPIEERKAA